MEAAEEELERRSQFLNNLIQKKKAKEQLDQNDQLNVRIRASDMPLPLQNKAFKCARELLDSMPGKLDSKHMALALKKEFDSLYGPAWHCIVGTSFGSYVTHSLGGFLYFSIDKVSCYLPTKSKEKMEIVNAEEDNECESIETSIQMVSIHPSAPISTVNSVKEEPGPPHEALFLTLAYLPVYELLAMSEVCMSLRDAVNKDILPWLSIVFDKPLNRRLSDEILMKVAAKANERVTTLALISCFRITNSGLQGVIEKNPCIRKLYVPGCTGLTAEGIIEAVKKLSQTKPTLEILHISGIYNITTEHLKTLHSFLSLKSDWRNQQKQKPILYHEVRNNPALVDRENYRSIDVEICQSCSGVQMVFDCSRQLCKGKALAHCCRGCSHCIPRCAECGGCVDPEETEDAVCNDTLCSDCWLQLPKCNLCNKPYCRQHGNLGCNSSGSSGFVCDVCEEQNQKLYHVDFTD